MQLPSLEEVEAELARRDLAEFVRQAWPILEPGTPLLWNWHLDAICSHIQALLEGRLGFNNLIVNVPPGAMKSTIVSVCAPAWRWIDRPEWRGLCASGSEGIALRDSMKCRDLIESGWYQRAFSPTWTFTRDQNAKGFYKNTAQGFRKAISAGAKITGERAHTLIVDDPNDASHDSKADRAQINYWWDYAAANRVANPETGTRCIIQQRLNEEDLSGHILAKEREDWDVLVVRQEYEPPTEKDPDFRPTGLGWVDPRTEVGELFFPARFPPHVVAQEKRRLASAGFAGQHQQRPAPASGNLFKKGFVQTFKPGAEPKFKRILISLDSAFKEKEENDASVALVGGEADHGIYLLDRWKDRVGYPGLKLKATIMADRWRPHAFLIEDKASGQSLIQDLRSSTLFPLVAITPDRDKVARANACTPTWEAMKIYVPEGAEWVDDFLEQLYGFPKLAHDDDVDALTQLILYITQGGGATGLLDWIQPEVEAMKREQEGVA